MSESLFEGLKVLDVGSWIAGPVAATMLADYGADVVKIEPPASGDGYRALSQMPGMPRSPLNYSWRMDARNKRSLTLNLKHPDGHAILMRLVAQADVYVTNQPLSLRRTLKLEYDDLRERFPRLVYASLTAYGEAGPERDREGFDLVAYWSRTGLMDLVRAQDAPPTQSLPGMGDHPTAVALYAAIVTALLRRERTGRGSHVHTSLLANGLWAASCIAQAQFVGADFSTWRIPGRGSAMRLLYRTANDRWLQFTMVRTAEEFERLLNVLGLLELLDDPRFATAEARLANGDALGLLIADRLAVHTSDHWMAAFTAARVPGARVGRLDDLPTDPQILENRMVLDPATTGAEPLINHPVNVDELERARPSPAPALGEHSATILGELGYTLEEIRRFEATGVI
jgi:crotonobetainyl-CoA:carnitine CoA-transferase CaiB-like acyl-CoA transferase